MSALVERALVGLIRFYRATFSPILPPACRYTPTCSRYAEEAVRRFGPRRGSWLALRRLLRCHPWGGRGWDPVPRGATEPTERTEATGRPVARPSPAGDDGEGGR